MARFIVRVDDREQTAIDVLESTFDCEELVCCQNCKYWDGQCQQCERIDGIILPDFYCADGERKSE